MDSLPKALQSRFSDIRKAQQTIGIMTEYESSFATQAMQQQVEKEQDLHILVQPVSEVQID
jgi:hypothetical protein